MVKNNRNNSIRCYSLLIVITLVIFTACTSSKDEQVTDCFYLQIYDSEDRIVSKYKITLTGTISDRTAEITSVTCINVSGDLCLSDYIIDGATVCVTITHPTEGKLMRIFALDANGKFSGC